MARDCRKQCKRCGNAAKWLENATAYITECVRSAQIILGESPTNGGRILHRRYAEVATSLQCKLESSKCSAVEKACLVKVNADQLNPKTITEKDAVSGSYWEISPGCRSRFT